MKNNWRSPVEVEADREGRRSWRLGVAVGMVSLLSLVPTSFADLPNPQADAPEAMTVEALVREVYARHERQVTASGTPLTVEISNVRTIPRSDFGRVKLREVLSVRPSHSIGITISTYSLSGTPIGISFPARWITNSPPDAESEEASELSVEGIFERYRESGEDVLVPEAIVAFDSRVTLEGRSVAYKAYFMLPEYQPGEPPGEFRYHDPVLLIEPELLVEERTARPAAELRELVMHAQPGPP